MPRIFLSTLFALGILIIAPLLQADDPVRQIVVNGVGRMMVQPNMATVQFSFTTKSRKSHQAKSIIDTQVTNLLKLCNKLGIEEKDRWAADLHIYPEYEHKTPRQHIGYRVSRNVRVTLRNMSRYPDLLDGAVGMGANLSGGPHLDFSNKDELENEAMLKAFRQARQKAQLLAKEAGGRLGKALAINESDTLSIPNPLRIKRAMALESNAAQYPSGEIEITRKISVSFGFKI